MNWQQLIELAKLLAQGDARGRPRQVHLRKAVNCAYYAMFHALCANAANTLVGASAEAQQRPAWTLVYRALEHRFARNRLNEQTSRFSIGIQDFGKTFGVMQALRHRADYDPNAIFRRTEVMRLIAAAEQAITDLENVDITQRREVAAHILFRPKTD